VRRFVRTSAAGDWKSTVHALRPTSKTSVLTPRRYLSGTWLTALAALSLLPFGRQAHADTATEFWPELRVWIPVAPATRILVDTTGTRDSDTGERVNSDLAVYVHYALDKNMGFRAGVSYSEKPPESAGEERAISRLFALMFYYTWYPAGGARLENRVRADLGNDNGRDYQRYRDRLRLKVQTQAWGHEVTPYTNLEAFYDTRYDSFNRWRFELGFQTAVGHCKCADINAYFGRQRDTVPNLKYTNGIGIKLEVRL
jgi:uncharacterized protein DUF2490